MTYKFATRNQDYSDYASGRVFYNAPRQPAFPVRLTSEIFQRCLAIRKKQGLTEPVTVYDPCCGAGYLLSTLAYLHGEYIKAVVASDIDADVLVTAERNLGLLSESGLAKREGELTALYDMYQKESHALALGSVAYFKQWQAEMSLAWHSFQANVFDGEQLVAGLAGHSVDIVLVDVPYGQKTAWQGAGDGDGLWLMLDGLKGVLSEGTLLVVVGDKGGKCRHSHYQQIQRFQIGKRRVFILTPKLVHSSASEPI